MKETAKGPTLTFRWGYIIVPLVILLLSLILVAYFYPRLPGEVAYHFKSGGVPDRWLSRGTVVLLMLLAQFFFALLAGAITWGTVKLAARFRQPEGMGTPPTSMVSLMGNMVALPQAILCFAMLDIFSYNSYQIRIMPLWVFALIVMVLGGIILGIFFIRAIRQVWGASQ